MMRNTREESAPRRPDPLRKGDRIGVFLPSSPVREPFRSEGLRNLRDLGYVPVEVPEILAGKGFVAKSSSDVIRDLQAFFFDDGIHALWAARGGYGANLLCTALSRLRIPTPKIVIGSSDVSILLWNLMEEHDMVVFFGPMAYASLASGTAEISQLQGILTGASPTPDFFGEILIPGRARGRLTGGCLSSLTSLVGTPFFPVLQGRILLLEDRGERPYRLHRMFWQLVESGLLEGVRGLALGEFPDCFPHPGEREELMRELSSLLLPLEIPVVSGLPLGHAAVTGTVPLGVMVELYAAGESAGLRVLETGTGAPSVSR